MTRQEAFNVLSLWGREKLANVYNQDEFPQEACSIIIPGFEYPNFSYLTVREVINYGHTLDPKISEEK
jgi:hypothetical protein